MEKRLFVCRNCASSCPILVSLEGGRVLKVEGDATMRPGVVAMTQGFGPKPNSNYDPRRDGSNINVLLSWEDDPDPYHGMPRMSAVPVAVRAVADVA